MIKTLGDSVLFIVEDADPRAIDIAAGIITVIGRDPRMPDVRVGLATGPVVLRMGDVFGPAVNMAARLIGVARRNRVIIDERTAELLPEDQFETRRLPARPVRGFGTWSRSPYAATDRATSRRLAPAGRVRPVALRTPSSPRPSPSSVAASWPG